MGIDNTAENRRIYRQMLFTAKDVEKYISAAILDPETVLQKSDSGIPFPQLLAEKGFCLDPSPILCHIPFSWLDAPSPILCHIPFSWLDALCITRHPQPSTLNPQPSTLNPQPSTLKAPSRQPQPSTLNPQPYTPGIIPGVKPHLKAYNLPGDRPQETVMQGLDSLAVRAREYYQAGCRSGHIV